MCVCVYTHTHTHTHTYLQGVSLLFYIYRMSQEECARLRENVPYVKVHRYNPKHLYPKLNGYGDNDQRKVWSSCGSTYCTCYADALRVHCACPSLRVECGHVASALWTVSYLYDVAKMRAENCIATGGGHFEKLL